MRRKSERTVKTSPTKTPSTNRRTTRRNRKSPEKPIDEDESENSSDQASGSDSEPEEVIAPKRTRRTSRTIEKSSSAEKVKATTTTTSRPKRQTRTKKDADIKEEEAIEADQTDLNEPKHVEMANSEQIETTSVDSSTKPAEPADEVSQIEPDNSNNIELIDVEPSTTIATDKLENEKIETQAEHETQAENETVKTIEKTIVTPEKSKRRTLKRVEREVADSLPETNLVDSLNEKNETPSNENEVDSHDKSSKQPSIDEVKSSEKSKLDANETNSGDLQNGNSDTADTTAKDTTTDDNESSARLSKKKPIVRKRKWLSNKTAAPKVQEITISTDSLKGLISDVKPVPLSDVKLDSSPEHDHDSDDVKVVSSTSIDYNRRSEEKISESADDGNAISISTSRKVSLVNDSEGEQPPSPAKHNPCSILYITNLVRPFTVLQLKSLLQRTGKIAEDGFWIDKIKSKCFVKYETEDEAVETRHALHGIRWPTSNPKCLNVDFGTESLMEKAMASTAVEIKPSVLPDDRIVSARFASDEHDSLREKGSATDRPVREWDLGKKDSQRPRDAREVDRNEREKERERDRDQRERERENKPSARENKAREGEREGRDRDRERERGERDRSDRRRRSASASPSRKFEKKDNEPPLRLLDDLFRKTKTTPCIYWLPLTPEQIAVRIEERQKAIERREALRKEREREEAEERQRRREGRERSREAAREGGDRGREGGSDRPRDRPRESRDRSRDGRGDRDRDRHRDDRDATKRRRY